MRGGQPSTTTPTPPPCDSPQVVMRNNSPNEFAMRPWCGKMARGSNAVLSPSPLDHNLFLNLNLPRHRLRKRLRLRLRACNKKRCRGAPVPGRSNKVPASNVWDKLRRPPSWRESPGPRTATFRFLLHALRAEPRFPRDAAPRSLFQSARANHHRRALHRLP
jgi:hypothetical protein